MKTTRAGKSNSAMTSNRHYYIIHWKKLERTMKYRFHDFQDGWAFHKPHTSIMLYCRTTNHTNSIKDTQTERFVVFCLHWKSPNREGARRDIMGSDLPANLEHWIDLFNDMRWASWCLGNYISKSDSRNKSFSLRKDSTLLSIELPLSIRFLVVRVPWLRYLNLGTWPRCQ